MTLQEQFGQIDMYLFDQILRGNISPGMRVLDAGCGGGRNVQYLMREGYEVFGADLSADAVAAVRKLASELAPALPAENFQVASLEAMPFPDEFADVVVCHSVLHFAQDEAQLEAMVRGLWRVLRPAGSCSAGWRRRSARRRGWRSRRWLGADSKCRMGQSGCWWMKRC